MGGTLLAVREPLSLVARRQGKMLTMIARGELDAASAPTLTDAVDDALAQGVIDVLVDCRGMDFADTTGVGALLVIKTMLEERGGALILFAPREPVRRAFEVTGVETTFFVVGE
ncbi:MAG: anti-sigma factor antagonist [Actinomycetota bacterium]|nr:anti-sigma factor antagonist [Actinomycetota bacterium]